MKKLDTAERAKDLTKKMIAGWVDPMTTPIEIPKGL